MSDPNMRVYTPIGTGKKKIGIDKFMEIDEEGFKKKGFGKVEISIPASVLLDPEKNKKLSEEQEDPYWDL